MAIFANGPVMMISGVALAAIAGGAAFIMRDPPAKDVAATEIVAAAPAPADVAPSAEPPAEPATQSPPAPTASAPAAANDGAITMAQGGGVSLSFALGSMNDLRGAGLSTIADRIGRVEGVAEETKVWVARGDVARAPGVESIYHVKGPLTCGRIGCDIAVVGASGGLLLETVGETVTAPETDKLIINEGTPSAVVWVFDGARFVSNQ